MLKYEPNFWELKGKRSFRILLMTIIIFTAIGLSYPAAILAILSTGFIIGMDIFLTWHNRIPDDELMNHYDNT